MQTIPNKIPRSSHFHLEQINEDVYAAIGGGGAFSNSGIVNLGERTTIFNTFETPIAAEDLRVANDSLTGNPIPWVVNSHAHSDHWFGNQVFVESSIILASDKAWESMQVQIEYAEQDKSDPAEIEAHIEDLQKQYSNETDPLDKRSLEDSRARYSHYLESLPTLQPRLPNQTFRQEINFHGSERNAVLTFAGPAHTSGDAFLTLPSEKIAFIGDIGFFEQLPYIQDCDPFGWVKILIKLVESDLEIFIPGHGPVGTKEDLKLLEGYIILLRKWVGEFDRKGKPIGDLLQMELPEPYMVLLAVCGIRSIASLCLNTKDEKSKWRSLS